MWQILSLSSLLETVPVGRPQKQEPLWLRSESWESRGGQTGDGAFPVDSGNEGRAAGSRALEEGAVGQFARFWQGVPGCGRVLREAFWWAEAGAAAGLVAERVDLTAGFCRRRRVRNMV